jgi:hypothetical protein
MGQSGDWKSGPQTRVWLEMWAEGVGWGQFICGHVAKRVTSSADNWGVFNRKWEVSGRGKLDVTQEEQRQPRKGQPGARKKCWAAVERAS